MTLINRVGRDPYNVVHESTTDSEVSEPGTQVSEWWFNAGTQEKRKRKEKVSPNLTIEEEESIVEWLREHPETGTGWSSPTWSS